VRVDYSQETPVLAVRLQEMFGLTDTPCIAGGRVPLLLHLLSPAHRPVQITRDLAAFWSGAYHEVKKELQGRYPKHHWPDQPLQAQATARTRRRR
jgi:ATP-dependent helicase HrpB